jgi:tryptophan synthase beta chain
MKYSVDDNGYYGAFGGAFIPELLHPPVEELKQAFETIKVNAGFKEEYLNLLKDYVGRPTPLYYAKNLSVKYNADIYLKREDLNHTGAHKVNNTIGQILLAKKMGKTQIIAETGAGQHGSGYSNGLRIDGLALYGFYGRGRY